MEFEQYLRTTDHEALPLKKADVEVVPNFNGRRVNAFLSPEGQVGFLQHPVFQKAVKTARAAQLNDGLSALLPREIMVLTQLQNQICSSCRAKDVQLYTCTCCFIFQVCSKECLDEMQEKNPTHGQTLRRFH